MRSFFRFIEWLAISSPRLDSPTGILTPLKHLCTTNRILRQLVRPFLLERIILSTSLGSPWHESSRYAWNSLLRAIVDLSAFSTVYNNIRRLSLHHTWSKDASKAHQFGNMIGFMGCLLKLHHLKLCINITSLDFRFAIATSNREIFLRVETIKTLRVDERNLFLLSYCPNL
jgi:hypothetical protein